MARFIKLKQEHKESIIKQLPEIPKVLIDFMFDCWNRQKFKDACGNNIPVDKAIECIIKSSEIWGIESLNNHSKKQYNQHNKNILK